MNSKILLLSIAVVTVGLFAMPSTLSLFAGQHTFKGTPQCNDCHSDVKTELSLATAHTSIYAGTNNCEGCHQSGGVNASTIPMGNFTGNFTGTQDVGWNASTGNFTYPNASNVTYAAHAAITLECVFCHMGVNTSFTDDAHKPLADQVPTGLMKGKNAVCIMCHSKALKTITFVRYNGTNIGFNFTNRNVTWSNGTINTTTITT